MANFFEIKSAQLPVVALHLKSDDMGDVATEVLKQFGKDGDNPDFFDQDAMVLDFSHSKNSLPVGDLVSFLRVLRSCKVVPVAIRGASPELMQFATSVGLVETQPEVHWKRSTIEAASRQVDPLPIVDVSAVANRTMVIDKPVRSGQKIYAKGCDLVVLAMVNAGSEVVADGNIHVYAPLRGKAFAGAKGNTESRIFSLCMEPELISIAGVYRTSENPLSPAVLGKAAQVRLSDDGQERMIIEALNS